MTLPGFPFPAGAQGAPGEFTFITQDDTTNAEEPGSPSSFGWGSVGGYLDIEQGYTSNPVGTTELVVPFGSVSNPTLFVPGFTLTDLFWWDNNARFSAYFAGLVADDLGDYLSINGYLSLNVGAQTFTVLGIEEETSFTQLWFNTSSIPPEVLDQSALYVSGASVALSWNISA